MYWTYKSLPELVDLPPKERDAIWREAKRDPFRATDVLWLFLFLAVAIALGLAMVWIPIKPLWLGIPLNLAFVFAMVFAYEPLLVLRYRSVVRRLRHGG